MTDPGLARRLGLKCHGLGSLKLNRRDLHYRRCLRRLRRGLRVRSVCCAPRIATQLTRQRFC